MRGDKCTALVAEMNGKSARSWYEYRIDAMKEFAIEWAQENNVAYEDDLAPRMKAMRDRKKKPR
ncbi:MAG: hypothetical protein DMG65_23665 [Candidatus Angelobacter sp. Gp1-AA117]|nr:MAG: hypothetical protein DMG65_23665 [Candidatus Angelobacter sp. Gp1-AA117]